MYASIARHDLDDEGRSTEILPVRTVSPPDHVADVYDQEAASPQVIQPSAVYPARQASAQHVLRPEQMQDLMGPAAPPLPKPFLRMRNGFAHLAESHVLPGLAVAAVAGISAWAHSQPHHQLYGGAVIGGGLALVHAGIKAHRHHGADADVTFTKGTAGAGASLLMIGVGACAGLSPWLALAVALGLGGAYIAWHQWRHHKLERRREFAVALTAAANTGPSLAPYTPPVNPWSGPVSDEEYRLRQAFTKLGAPEIILSAVRRINEETWSVFADTVDTKISTEKVIKEARKLAEWTGARRVEALPGARPGQMKLVVHDGDDPLAEPVPGEGPVITSILDPLPFGKFEDRSPIEQVLAFNHGLIAGATDNGKSGVADAIIVGTLGCRDVVRILVDCKAGAPAFGVYRPVSFFVADNPTDGMRVLAGLESLYEYRGKLLEEKSVPSELNEDGVPVRKWRPEFGPFILAAIDELSEQTSAVDGAAKRIQRLNALVRYVGVIRLDATQTPSRNVFGGNTDARQNYQFRVGLRVGEPIAINIIMGQGAQGRGWRLNELDAQGKLMVQSRQHSHPRTGRGMLYTDEQIAEYVAQYAGSGTDLDEGSAQAFWDGFHSYGEGEEDGGGGGPRGGRPIEPPVASFGPGARKLYAVPTYPEGGPVVEPKYRDLWALLGEQRGPVSAIDLAAEAKRLGHAFSSESWVRTALRFWARNGWVQAETRSDVQFFWRTDLRADDRRDA
jgi:hypothetical protein